MFFLKELPTREMIDAYSERFDQASTALIAEALATLRSASLLIRELEEYFGQHGLSQLQFLILVVIDREPQRDSLSHGELASRLDVSKPVMSRSLKSLAEEGLLTLTRPDHDLRGRVYSLTDQGRRKLEDVLPGYFSLLTAIKHVG